LINQPENQSQKKVVKIEALVKNKDFISNSKNPSLLGNFSVTAVCGCDGGALFIFGKLFTTRYTFTQATGF